MKIQESDLSTEHAQATVKEVADDPKIEYGGLFLSAFYNFVRENVLIYDMKSDNPPGFVGYRLSKGKTLILQEDTGTRTCWKAEGNVFNFADAKDFLVPDSGVCVNYGDIGFNLGHDKNGITVNFGKVPYLDACFDEVVYNLGTVSWLAPEGSGIAINFGIVDYDIGHDSREESINIAVMLPHGKLHNAGMTLDNSQIGQRQVLKKKLKDIRSRLRHYRISKYPDCLGIIDELTQIGSRRQLEESIRTAYDDLVAQ